MGAAVAQDSQAARLNIHLDTEQALEVGKATHLVIEVEPKAGWHIYSSEPSAEGVYRPAEVGWEINSRGFEAGAGIKEEGRMTTQVDDVLGGTVRYYKEKVVFLQPIQVTESEVVVAGFFDYMACNEFQCIPFTADFEVKAKAKE